MRGIALMPTTLFGMLHKGWSMITCILILFFISWKYAHPDRL